MPIRRAALYCTFGWVSTGIAADWQSTLTKDPPGDFPPLRPLHATFVFGWGGITAATGDIHFARSSSNRFQIDATGRTIGLARVLWKLDGSYHAVAQAETLRPIEMKQVEVYRSKKIVTDLTFNGDTVTSERTDNKTKESNDFSFPGLFDLQSVMLYLRSQSLKEGSVYRTVTYPATCAYLVTVTVVGHEKIAVRAGTYNAIKLDLKLQRIGKNFQLEPYRKFRRANLWVADDADRFLLRVEAQIFIGTIFVQLQSIHYEIPKS